MPYDFQTTHVDRQEIVEGMTLAMLAGENSLLIGPPGTGKSELAAQIAGQVSGAKIFSTSLTKFDSIEHILGGIDIKKYREESILWYMVDNSIGDAHIAIIDEIFDATDALLRTMLGALNEKVIRKGKQVINCRLVSAIACSNFLRDNEQTEAVVDRFLFKAAIDGLETKSDRVTMMKRVHSENHAPVLSHVATIESIQEIVKKVNTKGAIRASDTIFSAYDDIVQECAKETKKSITDRRRVLSFKLAKASAARKNETEVQWEDLQACRFGLLTTQGTAHKSLFKSIVKQIINTKQAAEKFEKPLREMKENLAEVENQMKTEDLVQVSSAMSTLKDILARTKDISESGYPDKSRISGLEKAVRNLMEIGKEVVLRAVEK